MCERSEKCRIRMLIDTSTSGAVIGVAGARIKAIRRISRANIEVSDFIQGADSRLLTFKGTFENMATAICMVAQYIACYSISKLIDNTTVDVPVHMRLKILLLVPNQQIGPILGVKGANVEDTKRKYGVSIKISHQTFPKSVDKGVIVEGNSHAVFETLKVLIKQIYDSRHRVHPGSKFYYPTPGPFPQLTYTKEQDSMVYDYNHYEQEIMSYMDVDANNISISNSYSFDQLSYSCNVPSVYQSVSPTLVSQPNYILNNLYHASTSHMQQQQQDATQHYGDLQLLNQLIQTNWTLMTLLSQVQRNTT